MFTYIKCCRFADVMPKASGPLSYVPKLIGCIVHNWGFLWHMLFWSHAIAKYIGVWFCFCFPKIPVKIKANFCVDELYPYLTDKHFYCLNITIMKYVIFYLSMLTVLKCEWLMTLGKVWQSGPGKRGRGRERRREGGEGGTEGGRKWPEKTCCVFNSGF